MQRSYKGHEIGGVPVRATGGAVGCGAHKKPNKCRSFHFRYLELCRSKNVKPIADICTKSNATAQLEMYGDRLNVNEWLLIIEALQHDQMLQMISLRMRKVHGAVLEQLDTEKKAKLYREKPVLYTKFIFSRLVETLAHCIELNQKLKVLKLEGMPLTDKYIKSIAMAVAKNDNLCEISLHRSSIGDIGCECICHTVKYLSHIEKIDLSNCDLTATGAECIADMIELQKIRRYSEGWEQSLRYNDIDVSKISGLDTINIAGNTQIGDAGLRHITKILREDTWIKVIDMENCGLSDVGAKEIIQCLKLNKTIKKFSVQNNEKIDEVLQRNIRDMRETCDYQYAAEFHEGPITKMKPLGKNNKYTQEQLFEHIRWLQNQLFSERDARQESEIVNEELNEVITLYEKAGFKELLNNVNAPKQMRVNAAVAVSSTFSRVPVSKLRPKVVKMQTTAGVAAAAAPSPVAAAAPTPVAAKAPNPVATPAAPPVATPAAPEEDKLLAMVKLMPVPTPMLPKPKPEMKCSHQPHKLRTVQSEMRYVEANVRQHGKKFVSEPDYDIVRNKQQQQQQQKIQQQQRPQQIETNIGDSINIKTTNRYISKYVENRTISDGNAKKQQPQQPQQQKNVSHEQVPLQSEEKRSKMNTFKKVNDIDPPSLNTTYYDGDKCGYNSLCNPNISLDALAHQFIHAVEMGQGDGLTNTGMPPRMSFM